LNRLLLNEDVGEKKHCGEKNLPRFFLN